MPLDALAQALCEAALCALSGAKILPAGRSLVSAVINADSARAAFEAYLARLEQLRARIRIFGVARSWRSTLRWYESHGLTVSPPV
jgi:hypothetical protein